MRQNLDHLLVELVVEEDVNVAASIRRRHRKEALESSQVMSMQRNNCLPLRSRWKRR
jgi:hypothetical protein